MIKIETFKYIKKRYISKEGGLNTNRKMPTQLKELAKLYRTLDLADLEFLSFKAKKSKDRQRLSAISYASDIKSVDSERVIKEWENRYAGTPMTEEMINKYGGIDDNELQD